MHLKVTLAVIAAAGFLGQAMAQTSNESCSVGTRVSGTAAGGVSVLQSFLSGKTVCFKTANAAYWTWQEFHAGTGALIDWKKGSDQSDPTTTVGTWSAGNGNNAAVTYSYTGGSPYTFIVCNLGGGSYAFQGVNGAATVSPATLKSGQSACP